VNHFFDRTILIRYDEVLVLENESISGAEKEFRTRLQEGLAANRQVVGELLENLKDEGFVTLEDIQDLEKGYLSKILHTIAHLHDGFIGIDSRLYNLEEDSHGISPDLQQQIAAAPDNYWILKVKGLIASAGEDSLDALRTFEWKGKISD
jgi:hypothetical protein